jgi:hypothetical protein
MIFFCSRCPPAGPVASLEKDCLTLPDPADTCCTVTVCGNHTISDVMKAAIETERKKLATTERGRILKDDSSADMKSSGEVSGSPKHTASSTISMILPINDTSMMISIRISEEELAILEDEEISILYTMEKSSSTSEWTAVEAKVKELFVEGSDELHTIISNLVPGKQYYFKTRINGVESPIVSGFTKGAQDHTSISSAEEGTSQEDHGVMTSAEETADHSGPASGEEAVCNYKNKMFAAGEEFYDG